MRCMGISGVLTVGVLTAGVLTAGVLTAGVLTAGVDVCSVDSCSVDSCSVDSCSVGAVLTCIGYSLFSLVMRIVVLPIRSSHSSFFQSYSG